MRTVRMLAKLKFLLSHAICNLNKIYYNNNFYHKINIKNNSNINNINYIYIYIYILKAFICINSIDE